MFVLKHILHVVAVAVVTSYVSSESSVGDKDCPKSKLIENDLTHIIDGTINKLEIERDLKAMYQPRFDELRDKNKFNIEQTKKWYNGRLKTLENVLAFTQTKIKSTSFKKQAKQLSDLLEELPFRENAYNQSYILFNAYKHEAENLRKNCPCKNREQSIQSRAGSAFFEDVLPLTTISENPRFYCGFVSEVENKSITYFENLKTELISYFGNILRNTSTHLKTETDDYRNEIQNTTLKQLGRTFYDILTLQESTYHFEELVTGQNLDLMLRRANLGQFKAKFLLMKSGYQIAELRKICSSCLSPNGEGIEPRFDATGEYYDVTPQALQEAKNILQSLTVDEVIDGDMLQPLLAKKQKEIRERLLENFLKDTVAIFYDTPSPNVTVTEILNSQNSVKEEVVSKVKQQRDYLDALKQMVPEEGLERWNELLTNWILLLQSIGELLKDLYD